MQHRPIEAVEDAALDWAERSDLWSELTRSEIGKRSRRKRNSNPLILCGYGVSLRIEGGALVIRDGFTHYPQTQARNRYFPGDLELPPRILLLDGSGSLSFDVLSWLAEQGVALARVKWSGEVATVASGTGFAADHEKVCWQNETRNDQAARLAFASDLIRRKLIASIDTLEAHIPASNTQATAIAKATIGTSRLAHESFADINDVRAIEGECASLYFKAWRGLPIEWKATGRHPVPDDWRAFDFRSSLANGTTAQNRNASHPLNAMLNYAYTVKLAQLQIQVIADGYDPTIGILHHGRRGKPAYIFDLIEPERPAIDAIILAFVRGRSFAAADFMLRRDGVCRLSPQLARSVATLVALALRWLSTALQPF